MIPASHIACHLHKPLYALSRDGLQVLGHGHRLDQLRKEEGLIVVVDDTVANGTTYSELMPVLQSELPKNNFLLTAVYGAPEGLGAIDLCAAVLPAPHLLEWNFFNSGYVATSGFDFDGVFCNEIDAEDDDDGERYLQALEHATPKFLPRNTVVPLVVTARLEKYREVTENWLARYGVRVKKLVMGPWESLAERNQHLRIEKMKAEWYAASGLGLFVESCPVQSQWIAQETGKWVLCPTSGMVYEG